MKIKVKIKKGKETFGYTFVNSFHSASTYGYYRRLIP